VQYVLLLFEFVANPGTEAVPYLSPQA